MKWNNTKPKDNYRTKRRIKGSKRTPRNGIHKRRNRKLTW